MEQIRELIRKHIEANGYTIYSISNQSGINRTNLQKMLSGQRRLTTDAYDKLIPLLSLSPMEKEEFDKAFQQSEHHPAAGISQSPGTQRQL